MTRRAIWQALLRRQRQGFFCAEPGGFSKLLRREGLLRYGRLIGALPP
jgi:hypothetical protein